MQRSHIPDVAVAIFDKGQVRTAYCSLVETPPSGDSVFEAASLSKPAFAAGVLTLVRQHRLDLARPLSSYLNHPYEHQQKPFGNGPIDMVVDPRLKRVTARMVLSHRTGLPNWSSTGPLTFLYDPGQQWSYSGEGYVYLQRVIESIVGQPLDVFLQEVLLQPLGTTHSSFVWQKRFEKTMLPGHASSGTIAPKGRFIEPIASSTLYTTLNDYAQFISKLLQPATSSPFEMEEHAQVIVRPDLRLEWGLGLAIEDTPTKSYFHWGANPGFQSFFLCEPKTRRAVLFFTDSDNGLDLVDSIVDRWVPGDHPGLAFPMLHPKD